MKVTRRQSLETRVCVLTLGLLFVIVLGLGHITLQFQRSALIEQKTESFEALARVMSLTLQPSVASNQVDLSKKLAEQLRESNAELEYIIISGRNGRTLFADSKRKVITTKEKNFFSFSSDQLLDYMLGIAGLDTEQVYRSRWPILLSKGEPGFVSVGFSFSGINDRMELLQKTLLAWFAIALAIGVLVSTFLARGITAQIRDLYSGAQKVLDGNLDVTVPVRGADEVGVLTATFNDMVHAIKENQEDLQRRANTDSLTGLYNHRFFQERLAEEVKRADRHQRDLSLLMLDLDHFKNFNDSHGHPAGDAALKAVSQILRRSVRDIDVVGRYGGEEFAVIMPECSAEDAAATADRIRLAVQRHCFYGKNEETVPMTVSIGLAHYPQHSQEREGLIFAADVALYQSKSMGRNRVTVYSGSSAEEAEDTPYKFYVALHATDITTIESLAEAVDAKHRHPSGFSANVADMAVKLAQAIGMSDEDISSIRIAGLLRDIGQIGLPDSILHKEGPLSEEERMALEAHPSLGHSIVERSPHLKTMLPAILHHHERWDGTGYPFGLKGDSIPLAARVIHIADAYNAMQVDRPHRKSKSAEEAREELIRCSGTEFDPELVQALLKIEGDSSKKAA